MHTDAGRSRGTLEDGDERLAAAIVSFDIVPAYEARLDQGAKTTKPGEERRISVLIKNNSQKEVFGKVTLSMPDGWTLRRSNWTKEFRIPTEDTEQAVVFRVVAPASAEGQVPVSAKVQVGKETLAVSGTVEIK